MTQPTEKSPTTPGLVLGVVVSRLFAENAYIAHRESSHACLVFDPGHDWQEIVDHLEERGLTPVGILNTHGHGDHIAGNEGLKRRWPECPLVIGAGDAPKLTDPMQNLSGCYGVSLISPLADLLVREGDVWSGGGIDLEVLETPGHSAGHVVYVWKGSTPWLVFGGDVLFQRGIGRTDFPDGDAAQLVASIKTKLFTLPDDTIVLPGHGEPTTIGDEKRHNPFVGEAARSRWV